MDNTTLVSLKSAFSVAPSSELAKVIVLHSLEDENNDIADFIDYLPKPLSDDDAVAIADFLFQKKQYQEAVELLDSSQPYQAIRQVEILLESGEKERARLLYVNILKTSPDYENEQLNEALNIEHAQDLTAQHEQKRAKLRVVEKIDIAEITDLDHYREKSTNFKDVVGLNHIKKQIHKKIILPFHKPGIFQRFKKRVGGGVLLYGPPGCGKTLLARATAGECNATFYNIDISDVLDMYIGESEQKLHAIFEKARSNTPCVLFFDELEALAGKREHSKGSASHIVSQFLTELDGFAQNNDGVLVLASTNVPWAIDSAFMRPGRFDRMFFVSPPDKPARQAILDYYLQERPTDADIDTHAIASKTSSFSGADIANLIDMAADEAIDEMIALEKDVNISYSHMKEALKHIKPTTTEWLTTARNYARYANDGGRYDEVLEFLKKHGK
ncbi:ATP-binding protein [Photobacterium kasasachensis]|uniref:ATP-binding protein n=1 Tax=Photobacterium kasasachensis TaxID=2910240 RepID=UPI003D125B38